MTITASTHNGRVIFTNSITASNDLGDLLREYIAPFEEKEQQALKGELEFRAKQSQTIKVAIEDFISVIRAGVRDAVKNKQNHFIARFPDDENVDYLRRLDLMQDIYYLTDGSKNPNAFYQDLEEFEKNCCRATVEKILEPFPDFDIAIGRYNLVGFKICWNFEYSSAYHLLHKKNGL